MRMRTTAALVVALILPWAAALAQGAGGYRVIVHAQNPATSVDRAFVADAFLKKTTRWRDGELILPVDLSGDATARRDFTADVLKRSVVAVRSYWQQLIFSGRDVPPPELDSDVAVVKYVREHRGALGYVSSSADVSAIKIISVK
jgi:ABC-type phosphate transport system substrate-binding protein